MCIQAAPSESSSGVESKSRINCLAKIMVKIHARYGIDKQSHRHIADGLLYPAVFIRTVVKAENRLGTVGNTADRHMNHFAHGVNNGHGGDV